MSVDIRQAAVNRAAVKGVPCVVRQGARVALCTKLPMLGHPADVKAWDFPSSAMARDFVERAVRESWWKA